MSTDKRKKRAVSAERMHHNSTYHHLATQLTSDYEISTNHHHTHCSGNKEMANWTNLAPSIIKSASTKVCVQNKLTICPFKGIHASTNYYSTPYLPSSYFPMSISIKSSKAIQQFLPGSSYGVCKGYDSIVKR